MEFRTTVLLDTIVMPQIPQYLCTSDPTEHAELYRDQMLIKGFDDKAMLDVPLHAHWTRKILVKIFEGR